MAEAAQDKDKERHDALQYWGYLFQRNNCPTDKLSRLLRGIAFCISSHLDHHDSNDILPSQLAAFYRLAGGNYDPLFLDMPSQTIAVIYNSLNCLHSLQPDPAADGESYVAPTVPALKYSGFVTWQTIQILLGPEEHVPFIQNALQEFTVVDPVDGKPFPKLLPKEAFPSKPDPGMVAWHANVSERLRLDAQHPARQSLPSSSHHRNHSPAQDDRLSIATVSDEKADAANYFSNPHYKNREGRPTIVRTITKAPGARVVMQSGKAVGTTLRNIASPHLWSGGGGGGSGGSGSGTHQGHRRHTPERVSSNDHFDYHNDPPTSAGSHHHYPRRHPSSNRGKSREDDRRRRRRSPSPSSDDSNGDSELSPRSPRRGQTAPIPRRRKSADPPTQDHDEYYFGQWDHTPQSWQGQHRRAPSGSDRQPRPYANASASPPTAATAKIPQTQPVGVGRAAVQDQLHPRDPHRYGRSPRPRSPVHDDRDRLRAEDSLSRRGGRTVNGNDEAPQPSALDPSVAPSVAPGRTSVPLPQERRQSHSQNGRESSASASLRQEPTNPGRVNGVGGRRYANETPWSRGEERP
ncbi:MAG: hypothetical protein M1828_005136 [Chrysothrix sp. TS-e1954]|nr:MAG: hypothetical protein M1828_005136 [Chrysothrix sp. TS-e1954]